MEKIKIMMNHTEIEKCKGITSKQKAILKVMADYNEGWICEERLEENLTKIIKSKRYKK